MKLPGAVKTGVQSFGRHDIRAPMRVASAEAAAAAAWGDAFNKAAEAMGDIFAGQDEADGELALYERIASDRINNQTMETYLANTSVINLDDESVPELVREVGEKYASARGDGKRAIPTADLVVDVMNQQYKSTREATYAALKQFKSGKDLQAQYNKSMTVSWADGAVSAVKLQAVHKQEALRERLDAQVQQAIQAGDKALAKALIRQGRDSGVYKPGEAGEQSRAVDGTIDYMHAHKRITEASTVSELQAAEDQMESNTSIPLDKRLQLRGTLRTQTTFIQSQADRAQSRNFETGVSLLASNKLTMGWVDSMAKTHQISGGAANTLRSALIKPGAIASDPKTVDGIRGDIVTLRFPIGSETDEGIVARARALQRRIVAASTGAGKYGEVSDILITNEDAQALIKEVDDTVSVALGANSKGYSSAVTMIKAATNYSDMMEAEVNGVYPQKKAYYSFIRDLQNAMDLDPSINPRDWVDQNKERYTPELFKNTHMERVRARYPRMAPIIDAGGTYGQLMRAAYNDSRMDAGQKEAFRRDINFMLAE